MPCWVGHRSPAKRICRILVWILSDQTDQRTGQLLQYLEAGNGEKEKGSQWPTQIQTITSTREGQWHGRDKGLANTQAVLPQDPLDGPRTHLGRWRETLRLRMVVLSVSAVFRLAVLAWRSFYYASRFLFCHFGQHTVSAILLSVSRANRRPRI